MGHHDAVIGIEHQVPSAGQFPEPTDHGVFARAEALRKSRDLGRAGGGSERAIDGNAQVFKVHNAILADGTVNGCSRHDDDVRPAWETRGQHRKYPL